MSLIADPSIPEEVFQGAEGDRIIARPGEPIVNINASDARRKVNRYICGEISLMMLGLEPALVQSENRLLWRIPIVLATPNEGPIGLVGVLDVDAHTSDLLIPDNFAEELEANAKTL